MLRRAWYHNEHNIYWHDNKVTINVANFPTELNGTSTTISSLALSGYIHTPIDIMTLTRFEHLNSLSFSGVRVTQPENLFYFVTRLTSLRLDGYVLTEAEWLRLFNAGNSLQSLYISPRREWSANCMSTLRFNTTLTSLTVDHAGKGKICEQNMLDLSHNSSITELRLTYGDMTYRAKKLLAPNTRLKSLHFICQIDQTPMSDSIIKRIAANTNLRELVFGRVTLSKVSLNFLLQNTTLTSLRFYLMTIPQELAQPFAAKTTLRRLQLPYHGNLTDGLIEIFARNTAWQSLSLFSIASEKFPAFLSDLKLEDLETDHWPLTQASLAAICQHSTLRSLHMMDCSVNNNQANLLKDATFDALSRNTTLIHFSTHNLNRRHHYSAQNIQSINSMLARNRLYWGSVFYFNLQTVFSIALLLQKKQSLKLQLLQLPVDIWRMICQELVASLNLPRQSAQTLLDVFRQVLIFKPTEGRRLRQVVYNDETARSFTFFYADSWEQRQLIKTQGREMIRTSSLKAL